MFTDEEEEDSDESEEEESDVEEKAVGLLGKRKAIPAAKITPNKKAKTSTSGEESKQPCLPDTCLLPNPTSTSPQTLPQLPPKPYLNFPPNPTCTSTSPQTLPVPRLPVLPIDSTLFVGNLSFSVGEDTLMEFFTTNNHPPESVRVITNQGVSRG